MINTAQSQQIYTIRTKAIVLAITVIVLDQFSKWLVTHTVGYAEFQNLIPGIALTLRHNAGAAFSLLAHASGWQRWLFSGIAVIMSLGITIWLGRLKNYKKDLLEGISLGLILGGAIGNLIDRILDGYVIDFILLYYQQYSFPAFNIADSAICIGAALLTYDLITKKA